MRLSDIAVSKVLEGANWKLLQRNSENPLVGASEIFDAKDVGLFAAIIKMNDGSEHPALVAKDFSDGGIHTDTWVFTKGGWINLFADGFMRVIGRYHHDIFPFEIFIGQPWKGDLELAEQGADRIDEHRRVFREAAGRLRPDLGVT